ncbi:MAG: hypothetical protein KC468_01625 [Myxococcales bacterium]|nr:hypothetical protein [Myxococcales bacterium]
MTAEEAAARVDFTILGHDNALRVLILADSGATPGSGERDAVLESMLVTLARADDGDARAGFTSRWRARTDCAIERTSRPAAARPSPALLAKLPAKVRASAEALAAATRLRATCGDGRSFELSVDARARIVSFEASDPLDGVDVEAERRFVDYLNADG